MTLEEQFICGALQTLNEDAFEDVAVGSERPSPNGSTGEINIIQHPLAPISEEFLNSPTHSRNYEDFYDHTMIVNNINNNNNNYNNTNNNCYEESPLPTVIVMPQYTPNVDDTKL